MCMPIPRAPATQIVFNATGQQYGQTIFSANFEGAVIETSNLSAEDDRRIRGGRMSFRRLHAEAVRPPEGKYAAPDGPNGEIRESKGSPIRMRHVDPT